MTIRRILSWSSAVIIVGLLAGCASDSATDEPTADETSEWNDWVVVHFGDEEAPFPDAGGEEMIPTELAAADALESAGIGSIDGNDWGDYSYDLYFFGSDRRRMWEVLAPVFDDAPVAWTSVELMAGLEDPVPVVIESGS